MPINKAQSVVQFYVLCNHLKNLIRRGWKVWNVKRERIESVAEHIFGVQSLAIAIWSQYSYNIDIKKAICIGDQVFTDVLFANRMKMKCILCNNLVEKDQFFTKINKFFDKHFRKRVLKKKLAKNWRDM